MKVGIGKHNDDKDINLSTRGLINAISVEIVDANGNQVTTFVPTLYGLVIPRYDSSTFAYPNATTMIVTYTLSGVQVAQLTVVYTDSTKANPLSISLSTS